MKAGFEPGGMSNIYIFSYFPFSVGFDARSSRNFRASLILGSFKDAWLSSVTAVIAFVINAVSDSFATGSGVDGLKDDLERRMATEVKVQVRLKAEKS